MDIFENIMQTLMAILTFILFLGGVFILPMYNRFKDDLISQIEYKMKNLSYSTYEISIRSKYLEKQSFSNLKKLDKKLQIKMNQKFSSPEDRINEYNF
ncbi:hypothetical protein ACRCH0_10550 [Staphylococcus aureus]|uniref:hypothetical protein n=1 Tax=Staphylococcus epidermidis TaxID=1282 RepID=UPI00241D8964|nr:hypothetical protein [Staphylococcus epidermidis]MDH9237821.1 hypothetical protein [Staphylococcus epidermidis]MDH9249174.1 hypothetical protein [Staphylococcus epidermidis]